jgi:hypothetical protein
MSLRNFALMRVLAWKLRSPFAVLLPFLLLTTAGWAAPARVQMQVTGYVINADLFPADNKLSATAQVTFTALEDLAAPVFELNNGLQLTKVTGPDKKPLESERITTNSTVRFSLANPIPKGTTTTWTFEYSGELKGSDTSPVEGINFASIGDPISILMYPGRWFPMTGLYINRFTAEMHIRVPGDERAIGSGSGVAAPKSLPGNRTEYTFKWSKPGFPGTIIAGKFLEPMTAPGINNIHVYVTEPHKAVAVSFAQDAAKQFEFMTTTFGQPESPQINLVELPADTVSATWAPEIAGLSGARVAGKTYSRLLANTLAHQWWGSEISPATLNDAWITNGMSRYAELMYVEDSAGKSAFQSAVTDVQAGALAYDTEPLATVGRLDPFSPQFQSMTLEKGAMIFHMLRWEMGDDAFLKFLRGLLSQYTDKGVRTSSVQTVAQAVSPDLQLTSFFAQWTDGTGAPTFTNKYTVFRLGNNKGFRTVGSIAQDLDLFRMPVELRIETDGKTETRRVDVSGTESNFSVETFGRPRRISIDPQNWLLKSTPDLAVRVAVLRGQQQVAQGDLTAGLIEYQKALDANRNSSLASYRIGEVFYMQRNYQSAANSFRDALRGDDDPKWTEVWSHVKLGCIFDVTGQRDRAVNEYRLAVQTNDNTQGAVNQARAYMQKPCKRDDTAE